MYNFFLRLSNSKYKAIRGGSKIIFIYLYKYFFKTRNSIDKTSRVVISLTTYPKRVDKIDLVIKSILNQSYQIKEICLWLSKKDNFSKQQLIKLKSLKNVEVFFVEGNLKSHKKYYYSFKKYSRDYDIITVDDDKIYNPNLVKHLVGHRDENLNCVICSIGRNIKRDPKGNLMEYSSWNNTSIKNPTNDILPVGAGGVLYPKGFFHKLDIDKVKLMEIIPDADDIFLKLVSEHLGLKSVIINEMINSISISYKVQNSLYFKNVINNGNDVQIKLIENNFNKIIKNDFT